MKLGASYQGQNQCEFVVWGPNLDTAAVQIVAPEERLIPLEQLPGGYWRAIASDIPPGTCYFYQLNGGETHPDPASHFQPDGVHGASQVIDHQFEWTDSQWTGIPLESMIIYELHVGTFTPAGTFEAMIPHLKVLQELGVNAIELMPIAQYPGNQVEGDYPEYRNWGYDGAYGYGVQNSYGGPSGLKKLVDACHQHGIAVILDVVYNHFGPEGNYISQFGPYFTETYLTPWGSAVNFDDIHSPDVRHFFIQNALYWLDTYHLDGLRLDAIHAIYDLGAKHILEDLSENVAALGEKVGRKLYLIAESDLNNPRVIRPIERGGYGMDSQWSDDFHHALYALLTGDESGYYQDFGRCEHLAKAFRNAFVYDWQYSPHRQRYHGRSAVDCSPEQFVVCIQNHDQIGNRMMGERLSQLVSFEAQKLAAAAVLLSPFVPMLFMGEEYGETVPFTYFVSHSDPGLIHAVREGRKREFAAFHLAGEPLDPEAVDTFLMCKLNWEKRHQGHHSLMWSFYQHLIHLRRSLPALQSPSFKRIEASCLEDERVIWWRRWNEDQQVLCVMNFNEQDLQLQLQIPGDRWQKLLDSSAEKWGGAGALTPDTLEAGKILPLRSQSMVLFESNLASTPHS